MKKLKKILVLSGWIFFGVGILFLFISSIKKQNQQLCKGIKIKIDYENGQHYLDESDIKKILKEIDIDEKIITKNITAIDLKRIEQKVEDNPFSQTTNLFFDNLGYLNVEIFQRVPQLRVINNKGVDYYIDNNKEIYPICDKFTPLILVANGYVFDQGIEKGKIDSIEILNKLFVLSKYISSNSFWNAQIEQIYVNYLGEIELIPRVGNHTILFGNIKDMEEKFDKLMLFYKEGLKYSGWSTYSMINLKFKDQIVCTKY